MSLGHVSPFSRIALMLLLLMAVWVLPSSGEEPGPGKAPTIQVTEVPVFTVKGDIMDVELSPDGKSIAVVTSGLREFLWMWRSETFVVRDGVRVGGSYNEVEWLTFSPNGGSLAFWARSGDPEDMESGWHVVLEGRRASKDFDWWGWLKFSPDSKSLAYTGVLDDTVFVYRDGVELGANGSMGGIEFTPDSRSLLVTAGPRASDVDDPTRAPDCLLFIDGKEPGFRLSRWPVYSPARRSFAFTAIVEGMWRVFRNGKPVDAQFGESSRPMFSPDGKSFVFVAKKDAGFAVVRDGVVVGETYPGIGHCCFSQNSKSFAFVAKTRAGDVVIRDGVQVSKEFPRIERLAVSPDGRSLALVAVGSPGEDLPDRESVVRDGTQVGGMYEDVLNLRFSPDGNSLFWEVQEDDKRFLVKDGARFGDPYDAPHGLSYPYLGPLVFGPDGRSVAHWAKSGDKHLLIRDGIPASDEYPFDPWPELHYTPDGALLAFVGTGEYDVRKHLLTRDGVPISKEYDQMTSPRLSRDGRRWTCAGVRRGTVYRIYRIEVTWADE